ncbi:MAG: NAD-dependent malic enzyme [Bacteroidetes bacterium]|nr:NAD-dependent malic enzyme [Bacteroidota bacterium]
MTSSIQLSPEERGIRLLQDPEFNKGTAFTEEERDALGLHGLLPPKVFTQEKQLERIRYNLSTKNSDLERYIYMISLQDRNQRLFYRTVMEDLKKLMPIIYTPVVGQACQLFGHIYRRPRGLYITINDRSRIREILQNWPHSDVRVIVVTDGERILGLGDLGADGMGIPIGKLSLYTACAGIPPTQTLPILLDVGTNNKDLLKDPLYLGLKQHRVRGEAYDDFLNEFIEAVTSVFPNVLVQLEDFATRNAFTLLNEYKTNVCLFDDDIQGTASVAMAGIYSAIKKTQSDLSAQRLLFLGAGEAGVGIADLVVSAMVAEGLSVEEARRHCRFVDSHGLVCGSRTDLASHKLSYAHDLPFTETFHEAVREFKPTGIIGVSGQTGRFDRAIIETMSEINEQPIIFALSNPTSKSECTAEQAYTWSKGKAIFASGSPFDPVEINGQKMVPGQGNNVYIFPGIGLGIAYSRSKIITDDMFLEAARVLAGLVTDEDLLTGCIYPPLERIREVSLLIAVAITRMAIRKGLSKLEDSDDLDDRIREQMFDPVYPEYMV